MTRVIAGMLSYKMGERTDKTVLQVLGRGFHRRHNDEPTKLDGEFTLVENQDPCFRTWRDTVERLNNPDVVPDYEGDPRTGEISSFVDIFSGDNFRMTKGFNIVCQHILFGLDNQGSDVVWLCTNDFDIVTAPDNLRDHIAKVFTDNPDVGWWHPTKTVVPNYAYPWMHPTPAKEGLRKVPMTDFICPAIRVSVLEKILDKYGNYFNPLFYRGWGIDYETCYRIRQEFNMDVVVDDAVIINHDASDTYKSGIAPESQPQFYQNAYIEMRDMMVNTYGPNWQKIMLEM